MGGAQKNTLHTLRHLDRSRFEPILLCGRGAFLDEDARALGVPVHGIPFLGRPVNPVGDLFAFLGLVRALRRLRPDVVHTHSSKAGILGRWAARWAGVPIIVHTFHGFGFHREQSPWVRRFFIALERWTARVTTAFIAVSEANREEALDLGLGRPEQYTLIRSGVELSRYFTLAPRREAPEGLPLRPEDKLITTIGPMKPQKNHRDFLRAAARVAARRPEARFLIVGDGALRKSLERDVHDLRLGGLVFLPGWRRDIEAILGRTDVFCLTSLWEGLPRSLVEAMAAGLPCVANAVDGVRDLIVNGENGFRTPPHCPAATADRLIQLLENEDVARLFARRARASIGEEFDIDGMVRRQEALLESLVASSIDSASRTPGGARRVDNKSVNQ